MQNKSVIEYVIYSVVILLILALLVQFYLGMAPPTAEPVNSYITVITPNGLIKSSSVEVMNELIKIREKIRAYNGPVTGATNAVPIMNGTIRNLTLIINQNPGSDSSITAKELRTQIIHQVLNESVLEHSENTNSVKTIVEWDTAENTIGNTPTVRLDYIIKLIDITINMLKLDICKYGTIDLIGLYNILSALNIEIDKTLGPSVKGTVESFSNGVGAYLPYSTPSNLPYANPYGNTYASGSVSSAEDVPELKPAPQNAFSWIPDTLSLEAIATKDLVDGKTIGDGIGDITDAGIHYTTRTNSCMGRTVPDDKLWEQCTSYDMRGKKALQGNPHHLINFDNKYKMEWEDR